MKSLRAIFLSIACMVSLALTWTIARHPAATPASQPAIPAIATIPARLAVSLPLQPPPEPEKRPPTALPLADLEQIRAEIQEAAVQYSDSELPKFEQWLKSPDPAVRTAAADGLLQSGLAGGALLLKDAAAASKDPQEIQAFNEDAGILEAPPATGRLVESLKNHPGRKPARHFKTGAADPASSGR